MLTRRIVDCVGMVEGVRLKSTISPRNANVR